MKKRMKIEIHIEKGHIKHGNFGEFRKHVLSEFPKAKIEINQDLGWGQAPFVIAAEDGDIDNRLLTAEPFDELQKVEERVVFLIDFYG